jgi:molybdopterin/thiamine biosynthesis adenylyltransferase/rhodanese-related sulfurtransferase
MPRYRDLVAAARARIDEVAPQQSHDRLTEITVIDVREPDEWHQGAIPGALLLPRGILERDIAGLVADPATELVLYCSSGARSALAAAALLDMGYRNAASLSGGFEAWKTAGLPWGDPGGLTSDQKSRYARHVRLPEVGEAGQLKLLASRALIVGAGGLGSPAALYLAAVGVGTIGVVDDDVVDASNLQRQVLHNIDRLGMAKVDSARETLGALNPDIKVETHRDRLMAANAERIVSGYDIVIDGGDNFPTRYLVNDVSLNTGVPVVHGSIFRFEGQVSVFDPWNGPCYRCLHREPPPPDLAPSCAEAGVLGVIPGVIGSIQAMEAVKVLLGVGETLVGRLLVYDALEQGFASLAVSRDPGCPACGDRDRPPPIIDYDETCRPSA